LASIPGLILASAEVLVPISVLTAKDDWKSNLEDQLKSKIEFTKLGLSGNISSQGSVYILKVDNIQAMPTRGTTANINRIENGARKEAKAASRILGGLLNAGNRDTSGMQIDADARVGVTKINVKDNEINVQIVTLRAEKTIIRGTTKSEYLYTWLQFPFDSLQSRDVAEVEKVIFNAIVPEKP
jgi:hypothetical protein